MLKFIVVGIKSERDDGSCCHRCCHDSVVLCFFFVFDCFWTLCAVHLSTYYYCRLCDWISDVWFLLFCVCYIYILVVIWTKHHTFCIC